MITRITKWTQPDDIPDDSLLVKPLDFTTLTGYGDYVVFLYNYVKNSEKLHPAMDKQLLRITELIWRISRPVYDEQNGLAVYQEACDHALHQTVFENNKVWYHWYHTDDETELLEYGFALIAKDDESILDVVKRQLNSVSCVSTDSNNRDRICSLHCYEEFVYAYKILTGAFEYGMNCSSFWDGILYSYDKLEIEQKLSYANTIIAGAVQKTNFKT